jgi:hypothetical protein
MHNTTLYREHLTSLICIHAFDKEPSPHICHVCTKLQSTSTVNLPLSPLNCFHCIKMSLESEAVAGATIELLEARLRRLSYLLTGATEWTGIPTTPEKPASYEETVSRRVARLERDLEKLTPSVTALGDLIRLRTSRPVHC